MKTIRFNTGRKYTANGQRIVATRHDDGVVTFYDHDRMITGELRIGLDDDMYLTRNTIMEKYDHNQYDNTARAMNDGMMRGGCNSTWE